MTVNVLVIVGVNERGTDDVTAVVLPGDMGVACLPSTCLNSSLV